ncbi:MAG: SWIM zinc finger family protein [Chloroflexi bacterium]|nr:SWIM zinc finger family protein [Chloroflexota bacterium]
MDSTASRIVKARQYAEERDRRIKVRSVEVELQGDNGNHLISYEAGKWDCSCEEFSLREVCAHVMAMEEVLGNAVEPALSDVPGIHSSASRIVKARQYAEERDKRFHVHEFEVELHGDNGDHTITYDGGTWRCCCEEFALRQVCAHVMALEEILGDAVEPAMLAVPRMN